jgi:type I restriction enzyme, S subunit
MTANEWNQTTLGSIVTKGYGLVDGPFGSNLPASCYTEHGIPVIRGSNLTLGTSRFRADEFVFVSRDTAQRLERSLCRPFDIVFTKKGTLGQTGLVPDDGPYDLYLLSSNQMKLTVDRRIADPLFVYYVVSSPESTRKIIQDSEATGVPKTNVTYLRDFPIRLPPLSEQRAIAHILGALDDKIELNRRMNETLEAMARALFKSWFVDFDPVHAKAEGRPSASSEQALPGLPKPLADLFPDSFEDSQLEEIPKGWEIRSLCELLTTVKGRSYKSSELVESDTALVTLKSFARGGGYRPDGLKSFGGTYKPDQVVEPGELVIACTDVTQAAEVIGRPAMVRRSTQYQRLVASLDTLIVRPKDARLTRAFLYLLCGTDTFTEHTYAHTSGTTVLHLAKEAVPSFRFPLPPGELIRAFDMSAASILARIQDAELESETLATLRATHCCPSSSLVSCGFPQWGESAHENF